MLAVADVAVTLIEHANGGRYELLELETEPTCWRTFTVSGATVIALKPDLLAVTADLSTETHSFIEVDLGTEHLPAVLRKCRTYQRYHATGIEDTTRGLFPAIVWIVPDAERATKLRTAITAERDLNDSLFWVVTPDAMLRQLAPYGPGITT